MCLISECIKGMKCIEDIDNEHSSLFYGIEFLGVGGVRFNKGG